MTVNRYDEGDTIRINATFRDAADVLTDPTTVELRVLQADGTQQVYRYPTPAPDESAIPHDSTGTFHVDYLATVPGATWRRWVSTGAVAGADEDYFYVEPSRVV